MEQADKVETDHMHIHKYKNTRQFNHKNSPADFDNSVYTIACKEKQVSLSHVCHAHNSQYSPTDVSNGVSRWKNQFSNHAMHSQSFSKLTS